MNFLLDTNVISEGMKERPNSGVVKWVAEADEDRLFISVVTLAELRHGVERMPAGARRNRLATWLKDDVPARFDERVLPVDIQVAEAWGRTVAKREASGRPIGAMDAFIAATAERNDLALVTRNARDFEGLGLRLLNPWTS